MMQGLGGVRAARPGSYAQQVTVAADAVTVISADPLVMAELGLAAVTALSGLERLLGARVTGVLSRPTQAVLVEAQDARVVLAREALPRLMRCSIPWGPRFSPHALPRCGRVVRCPWSAQSAAVRSSSTSGS